MQGASLPVWQEAATRSLFVSLPTLRNLNDVPALRRVLEMFPSVRVVVRQLLGAPHADASELFALGEFPNVYFTFSLHNIEAARTGPSTPQALFEAFIRRFGADHLMWGSRTCSR
jgi:L-fuconolactonase